MSGTIAVTSQLGRGSTFIFAAPFGISSERAPVRLAATMDGRLPELPRSPAPEDFPVGPRLRVLVAEDNEFNADLIRQLL